MNYGLQVRLCAIYRPLPFNIISVLGPNVDSLYCLRQDRRLGTVPKGEYLNVAVMVEYDPKTKRTAVRQVSARPTTTTGFRTFTLQTSIK